MVFHWEPETHYDLGTVVQYDHIDYRVIQAHTSEANWTPPEVPALFERLPDMMSGYQHHPQPPVHHPGGLHMPPPSMPHEQQPMLAPNSENKTHHAWMNMSDDRKRELEIGGGLLAGIAVIGAGYYAYSRHEKNEEKKKAHVFALTNWLREAEERTREFYERGPQGPVTWVLNKGHTIPQGAIQGGMEDGHPFYICRAYHEGGIHPGKAAPEMAKGACIGYGNEEIHLETYEILLGDPRAIRWIDFHQDLNEQQAMQAKAIEAGHESDGRRLYVIQAQIQGGVHPGKVGQGTQPTVPWGGEEKYVESYKVLCYA